MSTRITIESDDPNVLSFFFDLRRLSRQVAELTDQSRQNERLLRRIGIQEDMSMARETELLAAVSAQTTVIASVGAFIQTLKEQLLANGVSQEAIDAALEGVTANSATAAMFVNTPTPPPEPGPEPAPEG